MRALITGGYGFVGRHLARHLVECGDDVAIGFRSQDKEQAEATPGVNLPKSVQAFTLDVTDRAALRQLISLAKPDAIYHLAGVTFVPQAENDIFGVFQVNTFGTINLLDAIAEGSPESRVLCVSSAEVYGEPIPGGLPLTEQSVFRPISSYGVTKAAADVAAFKYAYRNGLHTVRIRPFPHIGPGQSDQFSISSFAKQLAEIKLGKREAVIKVGNLEAKRDFSDVSDIVRGYREALLNGKRGEAYNLCSGKSIGVGEVLQKLIAIAEINVEVVVDPERLRAIDITDLYGSYQKAQKDFGWKPRIDLDGTLHSIFAYWLEALSAKKK